MKTVKSVCIRSIIPAVAPCFFLHTFILRQGYASTIGYMNHERYAKRFKMDTLYGIIN